MSVSSIFWIIISVCVLIVIIGVPIALKGNERIGIKMVMTFGKLAIAFFFLFAYLNINRIDGYDLKSDQSFWGIYNVVQIDSCMYLDKIRPDYIKYSNSCNDSITHYSKKTEYDLFDVYSVTDEFFNRKTGQGLTYYFVKPNIIRDSVREVYFEGDTLTKSQGDSILKEWGLFDRAYKRWDPNH